MYRILYVTSEKKINEMMLEYAKSLEIEMVDEVVVPRLENYEVDEEVAEQKISQLDMKLYDAVICRGGMEKVLRGSKILRFKFRSFRFSFSGQRRSI